MARAKGIPALELYRLAQKKKRKLVLCGHSLGGAVSSGDVFLLSSRTEAGCSCDIYFLCSLFRLSRWRPWLPLPF